MAASSGVASSSDMRSCRVAPSRRPLLCRDRTGFAIQHHKPPCQLSPEVLCIQCVYIVPKPYIHGAARHEYLRVAELRVRVRARV